MSQIEGSLLRSGLFKTSLWLPGILFLMVILIIVGASVYVNIMENGGTFHVKTTLADLDGDGDQDVILHNVRNEAEFTAFGGITLWLNQGGGRFSPQAPELGGWSSAPGDVDQDGDPDLVFFPGDRLQWALNQGGEFKVNNSALAPLRQAQFGSILTGDLNGDSQVDAAVLGCCGRSLPDGSRYPQNTSWVWINTWRSNGRVNPQGITLPALDGLPVGGAALGDLDGDGDLDLFAGILTSKVDPALSRAARVLLNDGAGGFADTGQRLGEGDSFAVALGDLDGDGDLDAVLGKQRGAEVWINQGREGIFAISSQKFSEDRAAAVYLSDLDRDGDLDAILASTQAAQIWWNDGRGSFTRSEQVLRFSDRQALAVADFTGDGYSDIFAGDSAASYRLWINQGNGTLIKEG